MPCALFGFADQDNDDSCNVMLCGNYESMHNEDLGTFLYIIEGIDLWLVRELGSQRRANIAQRQMNANMSRIPRAGEYSLLIWPSCNATHV